MTGFTIRRAAPGDLDAIVAGFARACDRPEGPIAAKIRWGLEGNPAGWTGVVGVDGGGRLVAHLGATHVPATADGRPMTFGRIYASWVDPRVRTAGVHSAFAEIDDAFAEACHESSLAAAYGVFADPDWWTLRRMRDFAPVRTELGLVRSPGPHRADRPLVEVVTGSADVVSAWDAPLDGGPCATRRDSALLAFRLGGPHAADRAHVASRAGRPSGIAIVRDAPAGRVVLDFTVPEGDEESARALFDRVVGDGSVPVRLDWFSRSPWFLLAQRTGFHVRSTDLVHLGVRAPRGAIDAHWLMEHWRLAQADLGLHALPGMLASEEIVTSPPIGTLTGRERHA
jgi:hypothetical protein